MAVASPIVQNASQAIAAARVALAEVLVLKVGQVLDAVVVGKTSDSLTLKIGDQVVAAKVPQLELPVGSALQLQVKTTGSAPQLQVVGTTSTGQSPAKATTAPAPTLPSVPLAAGSATVVSLEPAAVHTQTATPSPQPIRVPVAPEPANSESAQHPPVASSQTESKVPSGAPLVSSPPKPNGNEALPLPAISVTAPKVAEPPPTVRDVASAPTAANTETQSPRLAPEAPGLVVARAGSSPPQPVPQSPSQGAVTNSAPVQLAVAASQEVPEPSPSPVVQLPAANKPAPPVSASPAQVQAGASLPAIEPAAPNPLLLAQSAPRSQASVADLPRSPAVPAPTAVVSSVQPPPPLPVSPQAALAQMLPEALSRQDSAGPLLTSLAAMVQKPGVFPEPVLRAALGVLAQRIIASDGKVQASQIEQAVVRSGVALEASLLQGTPESRDTKAGLLALREALRKWLGSTPPAPFTGAREAAPPPIKGLPMRALPIDVPPLPDVAKDAGGLLHGEADAAISRLKLMQLASLPDSDPGKPTAPSLRMELPFLIGHELVMAQIQVGRDAPRREQDRKRGWTMRFALNFSQTGEVGAEIGVLGKAVNVALWAAEPDTAVAMSETLPELTRSLEAVGLKPGAIRIRHGVPVEPEKPVAGRLLDSIS